MEEVYRLTVQSDTNVLDKEPLVSEGDIREYGYETFDETVEMFDDLTQNENVKHMSIGVVLTTTLMVYYKGFTIVAETDSPYLGNNPLVGNYDDNVDIHRTNNTYMIRVINPNIASEVWNDVKLKGRFLRGVFKSQTNNVIDHFGEFV